MPDAAALAIDLIRRSVSMRTPQLAEKLGIGEAAVDAMLEPARLRGELITCDVHAGGRRVLEYRCSVAGGKYSIHGGFTPLRDPSRAQPPRLDIVEKVNAGAAAGHTGRADQATQMPLPPLQHHQGESMTTKEKIVAALRAHGPMTASALREKVKAEHVVTVAGSLARVGVIKRLGGGKRSSVYGLPGQKPPAAGALERGADLGRKLRAAKERRKPVTGERAGGSAAMRRKQPVKAPAKPARASAKHDPFEAAITSSGNLILLNARRGELKLTKDELRGFVKALRHLNEDEVCHVLDFITRLDGAQVAA